MWFKNFIKSNLYFLIPFFVFVVVGGCLLFLYTKEDLLLAVNSHFSPSADIFFKYYTHVGDGNFYLFIAFLILLFVSKFKAILMVICYAFTSLPVQLIKYNIPGENFRPRSHFWLDYHKLHFVDGVEIMTNYSFPSGHTTSAFSMFFLLSCFAKNKNYSLLFFVLALMVGYSRMYLGQHFFADIYGGAIIGTIFTMLLYYFLDSAFKLSQKENFQNGLLI